MRDSFLCIQSFITFVINLTDSVRKVVFLKMILQISSQQHFSFVSGMLFAVVHQCLV